MSNREHDTEQAAKKIADYLTSLTAKANLELSFHVETPTPNPPSHSSIDTSGLVEAADAPEITVDFSGPDTPLLLARNGELLHAIEHLAAKILGLEPEEHDRISFDAEGFKASRDRDLERSAETAIQQVRTTGRPYSFPPMTSRERRMLHLLLTRSRLPTASSGEAPRRFVVLYPEGSGPPPQTSSQTSSQSSSQTSAESPDKRGHATSGTAAERAAAVRSRFRRR